MMWGKVWIADPETLGDDEIEAARRQILDTRPTTADGDEHSRRDLRLRALERESRRRHAEAPLSAPRAP